MSDFNENLKCIKKDFQKTKANTNYLFYWVCILVRILWFQEVFSEWVMLRIWMIAWIWWIALILTHVSADMKYLEKRIENIESEIRDINEELEQK